MTTDELLLCTMVKLSDRDESTIIIISYVCVMGGYEGKDVEGALFLEKTVTFKNHSLATKKNRVHAR